MRMTTPPVSFFPPLGTVGAVAVGGAIGALARLGVYHAVQHQGRLHAHWTTFIVNVIGCFFLGLVLGWAASRPLNETLRAFLTVGILGAFTTFSTYAGDALKLLQQHRGPEAAAYLLASVAAGLASCWAGYALLAPGGAKILA